MTEFPEGLAAIASLYDGLLCDVWGVVHDGEQFHPGPCDALTRWRGAVGPVVLISNSPRPAADVIAQLDELGVPRDAWSSVVTSGDATRRLLADRAPGPALAIGPARDASLYADLGLVFSELEDARFIAVSGLTDDETETPSDYRPLLERSAARNLEMLCANPDTVVQRGGRLIYCAGALAALYQALGGRVVVAGKPHPPIYDLAMASLAALTGREVDRRRVLVIGDAVATDMVGAASQALDALFIGGGIHGAAALTREGRLDRAQTARLLAGAPARFAMTALAWEGSPPPA